MDVSGRRKQHLGPVPEIALGERKWGTGLLKSGGPWYLGAARLYAKQRKPPVELPCVGRVTRADTLETMGTCCFEKISCSYGKQQRRSKVPRGIEGVWRQASSTLLLHR